MTHVAPPLPVAPTFIPHICICMYVCMCMCAASGFCDYSETRYQGSIYKWPESVGRDVILLPCPSRGGHLTRMCSGDGEGWLPVNTTACDNLDSIIMEISNFTVSAVKSQLAE